MRQQTAPLAPHIQIYRPQLTSVLSILHRASGIALTGGAVLLVWWLAAAASGREAYDTFSSGVSSIPGRVFLFGWTLAFFYHLANGLRHLWCDTGRGLVLPSVYRSGWSVVAFTAIATLLAWIAGYWIRGG